MMSVSSGTAWALSALLVTLVATVTLTHAEPTIHFNEEFTGELLLPALQPVHIQGLLDL